MGQIFTLKAQNNFFFYNKINIVIYVAYLNILRVSRSSLQ